MLLMRLFIYLLLLSAPASAQSLLMNGGFEDENICTEYIKNCAPEGWISTSLRSNYYFDDVKHAFEGQHFAGIVVASAYKKPPCFLRSRLLCSLREGAAYELVMYVRTVHPGIDSIGIYFSSNDILYQKGIMNIQPQLWIKQKWDNADIGKWQKISLTYTASGTENFITLGSFKKGVYKFSGRPDLGVDYYVFIDNISLVPLDPAEKMCAGAEKTRAQEYEQDERHGLLEKKVYIYSKNPPQVDALPKTILQKIDTLVIPDVLFATNSYVLSERADSILDSFVTNSMGMQIDSVVVEGHTDSTGSEKLNRVLSENRASSVGAYLQPHFTVPLISRGWASSKPAADNRTPVGRQRNRRVEVYLYIRE